MLKQIAVFVALVVVGVWFALMFVEAWDYECDRIEAATRKIVEGRSDTNR